MKFPRVADVLPDLKSAGLSLLSAILLILAFPDFEYWFLAWFGLVPLLWAIEREKASFFRSLVTGWIFGFVFFFGTCWWLTFAPITYAAFPPALAYFFLFCVTALVGLFPAIFSAILAILLRRFGTIAILAAPLVWVFTEFLRYWLTGNNWNALGYSQAFDGLGIGSTEYGGVLLVSGLVCSLQALFFAAVFRRRNARGQTFEKSETFLREYVRPKPTLFVSPVDLIIPVFVAVTGAIVLVFGMLQLGNDEIAPRNKGSFVIAVQPNIPMSGLDLEKWREFRSKHVALAESALRELPIGNRQPTTVIFPESPMNFMYDEDPEFQEFVSEFAARNNVNVLFNSAEPDPENKKYFNSAVLVGTDGKEIAQYDKIYLLPFGESVPGPLQAIVPAFVGSFSFGKEYDLLPLGDARAGVMICFESHFGELSRRYVRDGADVLIEMTNDGYLGPTPVLRQHLANAVFRAVETNRPVLRVTNVGVTAYINERGEVLDAAESYTEAARVWSISKSDGSQTFYVKYGDWFAWLCCLVTITLLGLAVFRRKSGQLAREQS